MLKVTAHRSFDGPAGEHPQPRGISGGTAFWIATVRFGMTSPRPACLSARVAVSRVFRFRPATSRPVLFGHSVGPGQIGITDKISADDVPIGGAYELP
jgi:hypothetical protein